MNDLLMIFESSDKRELLAAIGTFKLDARVNGLKMTFQDIPSGKGLQATWAIVALSLVNDLDVRI